MIRKATYEDIPSLMEIFENARGIMRASGNMNQWNEGYPSEEIVRKDIDEGVCYVVCEPNKCVGRDFGTKGKERIIATMAFIPGPDPTYAEIHDGEWADDCPYHVIHRIAVHEPGHGAARKLFDWGFTQARSIRIDTHKDNVIMHHILRKYGFKHCGVIFLANGDPREAYQLTL